MCIAPGRESPGGTHENSPARAAPRMLRIAKSVPKGRFVIAWRFNAGNTADRESSPGGTAEITRGDEQDRTQFRVS
jgi:hypothetical protein